jgi:hypothetical protein
VDDPGRRHLPIEALVELARYEVRTTTELDDLVQTQGRVYALRPGVASPQVGDQEGDVAVGVSPSARSSSGNDSRSSRPQYGQECVPGP